MRALQRLLFLVAFAACAVLGFLAVHVWTADVSDIEYLRRDVSYGWLLIRAAPLLGVASAGLLMVAFGGLWLISRRRPGKPNG